VTSTSTPIKADWRAILDNNLSSAILISQHVGRRVPGARPFTS
jgi:hypothetical protein